MTTKEHRGYVIVDRPVHVNGLDRVIDFVDAGLAEFAVVQLPQGLRSRQALTRWFTRNAPTSRYLKVTGHWGRDTWLVAFPDVRTLREFRAFLHTGHQHFIVWQGNDAATFIDEASRVLELAKIDGRVEGARNGR